MNCKQGDLAIIVKSYAGNEGKIVRCLRYVGKVEGWIGRDRWETDTQIIGEFGSVTNTVNDSYLRPIRDSDKEDEMLRIVGKPEKETC